MIEVNNFRKSYGKKVVHKNVTFKVEEGHCIGLIGGSGAGKSVILRSLIGLEKPDSGEIWIEGQEISKFREKDLGEIRKKVAYAFQGGALFDSMTVFGNLSYPLKEHTDLDHHQIREKIVHMLSEFGLEGNENVFPGQLSGGMQKRVGLARAMMLSPRVLLYDEPTAGLDPFNTKRIQELILTLKAKGVTSILVTHDMPTAMAVCDRVAFLQNGEIAFEGKFNDLDLNQDSVFAKFMKGEAP